VATSEVAPILKLPPRDPDRCRFFVACTNRAEGTVEHPLLGKVLTCRRCLEVVGIEDELVPFSRGGGAVDAAQDL
jgi:hypothetical protein